MILDALEIPLFIICILLSAFFSSSEVALIGITRAKVRTLVNDRKPGSQAVAALKESPEHLLITILIGNTIVNITAAAIATAIAIQAFGDIGVGIATGFVVIVLLVFGEIGPKIYAARASDSFALTVAPVMLYSVLEFGDTTAREIMTPRVDVILMEDTVTFEEAIRIFNETGFSRIPV